MDIVVPELGESIVDATVARWLKKEGEPVSVGEPVVALETDKVDLEVGARQDGVLARITHHEGEDVKVGEVLGVIEPAPTSASTSGERKTVEETTPEAKQAAEEAAQRTPAQTPKFEPPDARGADGAAEDLATPVARRFAQEQGIDLSQVPGSGRGDRITKEDIQRYLDLEKGGSAEAVKAADRAEDQAKPQPAQQVQTQPTQVQPSPPVETGLAGRREERLRMSRRRRTIATRLVEAQHTAAMLTTFNDVDMSAVIEIRKRRKESFQSKYGIKLGFMSFFVKAAIGALKTFPQLNAEIQGDEIVLKHYYDIGMAIGAKEGLVVPVLRDADRMSFPDIEKAIEDFANRTKEGTLSLEDLRGGTFTITNGGVFGSLLSTPILNPPQVGILGLHRIEERPVAVEGQVVIRPMMYLALSYDHRIVDGREAVQFLVRVKDLIQDPETFLIE